MKRRKVFVVGVTGGIACGKSTVGGIFERLGAEVIDADKIARREMSPGTVVRKKVVAYFGKDILNKDLSIDRAKLGKIVFADAEKRRKLEEIVHPAVIKTMKKKVEKLSTLNFKPSTIVVIDVPLLIEANLTSLVDKLVVVTASRRTRIGRLKKRGLEEKEAERRIDSQMCLKEKIKLADYVVRNNGPLAETEKQVKEIWEKFRRNIGKDGVDNKMPTGNGERI